MLQSAKLFSTIIVFIGLTSQAWAQTTIQQQRLDETVSKFFKIYNSGDSAQYYQLLLPVVKDSAELNHLMDRYKFTYAVIGKVNVKKVHYLSPTQADVWSKDEQFDSWWKFSIITDSNQHFLQRQVKPDRFPGEFVHTGKEEYVHLGENVDHYINQKLGNQFSGNVFISHKGKTLFTRSYGKNDKGEVNSIDQQFGLASMGKLFTAISILQLQEKGKLKLSDSVGHFLPELKNKAVTAITIEQLLTHTSGMGDFFESATYNRIKDSVKDQMGLLPVIEEEQLAFAPGKSWQYSNTGFVLLGIILEKITGSTYDNYIRKNIFSPAGMHHSVPGGGGGGGTSTIVDLLHFAIALLNNKLLTPALTAKILNYTSPLNDQYGLGTEHYKLGREHVVGHSGGYINECTELNIYPNSQNIVIILSNSNPPFGHFISDKIKELITRK
ncbi:MAG TPA: serine hydrolase domain-containing protein [Flavisolibacter sp.]|nr:serine hydrolase domain-containing protein [Flavisolibacter sp.]